MATTAAGTPYVESSDLVANYPGVSLALANRIDDITKLLQVISVVKTDTFTTTSTSFVDVTGYTVAITPSSSTSKILIIADYFISNSGTGGERAAFTRLMRDSTQIGTATSVGSRIPANSAYFTFSDARNGMDATTVFFDSPASTSALNYKIQLKATGNSAVFNRWGEDNDNSSYPRMTSTITVLEIAA